MCTWTMTYYIIEFLLFWHIRPRLVTESPAPTLIGSIKPYVEFSPKSHKVWYVCVFVRIGRQV